MYNTIVKTKEYIDTSFIKEKNGCSDQIIKRLRSLVNNSEGNLSKKSLEVYLQEKDISLSPNQVYVYTLASYIEQYFNIQNIKIKNAASLSGKTVIAFNNEDHIKLDCNNCALSGDKNIKMNINNRSIWLTAKVLKKQKIIVLKNNIGGINRNIKSDDITESVVFTSSPNNYFTDIKNIHFYKANRSLLAGHILKQHDLSARNLIKNGQYVTVEFNNNKVKVHVKARSLERGSLGQTIKLINPRSNKTIYGKIISKDKVVITI
ncbi:MAG: flagellar basal body P-ring formation chaperone FlgA [Bacteriovoracaceae bacterium]|jgi:flagella basal body P-ring formation protein FlgA|nr:flagellar basal body P-ring formation chaperone FlgA [Bacteriovoracaceae bacterium]